MAIEHAIEFKNTGSTSLRIEYSGLEASLSKILILSEGVQRRATKLISGLMGYTYEDRLSIMKLTTLEMRRRDLIQVFKMFKCFHYLDLLLFFELYTAPTRARSLSEISQT